MGAPAMKTMSKEAAAKYVITHLVLFVGLIVLTLLQLYLKSQHYDLMTNNIIQTGIALVKVFVVAYYFMHLREESLWLKFIAALPVFAVLYTLMVTVESLIR